MDYKNKKVYLVVIGNYALSDRMSILSSKELAEKFREYLRNERKCEEHINIFELKIDEAVLKEEDM